MKKLVLPAIALLLMLFLSGCEPTLKRYSDTYADVFDTVTKFTAYCRSDDEFKRASESVHEELLRLHRLFDIYDGGDLMKLNDESELKNADIDILNLIELGKSYYELSSGKLNIAFGSVLRLWHDARENGVLPDEEELKAAKRHTDISDITVADGTVLISDKDLKLDVGAVAKGYACEAAAAAALDSGIACFAIDIGGNVKTVGKKPDGDWKIGIKSPDGGIISVVSASDMSVVTSGDYERFFELDGVRYSHIIDPETLYPARKYRSVTVICESSCDGDALSTSLFLMDVESGKKLAEEKGAQAMWIYENGLIEKTEGFDEYEKP